LGVVNFAHGALFMLGAFCAVTLSRILSLSHVVIDESRKDFLGNPLKIEVPYLHEWFGPEVGATIIDWSVPLSILFAIPVMILIGVIMERGLIKHFYKRPHADQILVTFGLAIVLQEIIKYFLRSKPDPDTGARGVCRLLRLWCLIGFDANSIIYPYWRLVYFGFAMVLVAAVFSFLQFTTFGMVVRAGMADRETVGLLGINIDKRFTIMFGIAALSRVWPESCTPRSTPKLPYGHGFPGSFLRGGCCRRHGLLGGAVAAGFLLGVLESLASMGWVIDLVPGINQIIIYLVAIVILLTRPRGLMGRKGVMEE
jgi:branched-chain amino acid transport system permease protein